MVLTIFILMTIIQGCATAPKRNPLPENLSQAARVPGYSENIRFWGDGPPPYMEEFYTASDAEIERWYPDIVGREQIYLAVSGGGANGAYGVGLLSGWTAAGTRPEFTMVTGISTGALIAPFAFLGPAYDDRLKEAYTSLTTKDIAKMRSALGTLNSDAAADTTPLKGHIARYVDQEIIGAIAREFRRGRRLFIGTVNLDALRPVLWNIGYIAASGRPDAGDLIRTIMLASASIPAAFPPQYIPVEANGARYDEIHVDGGTVSQAFLYPMGVDWPTILKRLKVKGRPKAYIIRNSRLAPKWNTVDPPKTLAIAGRAADSMIRTQGIGDLYRMYLASMRDGIEYHWTAIPDDFNEKPKDMFDPEYMQKLVKIGFQRAMSGTAWQTEPPSYKIK
jgi:predicted acylesterase/phospholipase RssA